MFLIVFGDCWTLCVSDDAADELCYWYNMHGVEPTSYYLGEAA